MGGRRDYEALLSRLDRLESERVVAAATLDELGEAITVARSMIEAGGTVGGWLRATEAWRVRADVSSGLTSLHHALKKARAEVVRVMVDVEGMSVTDVARLLERPRQLVQRLYASAKRRNAG